MIPGINNVVYDTNFVSQVPGGGFPIFVVSDNQQGQVQQQTQTQWKKNNKTTKQEKTIKKTKKSGGFMWAFEWFIGKIFPAPGSSKKTTTKTDTKKTSWDKKNPKWDGTILANADLKTQVQALLTLPDEEYSDKKLTSKLRQYILEVEKHYNSTLTDFKSHISPSFWEFKGNNFNISGVFGRSYYVHSYPSYIDALWTRDLLSFHGKWDMSFFLYPEDDAAIQSMLKQKATQLKAEINTAIQKWITLDTEIEQQYKDIDMIRHKLTTREERYFETGFYVSTYNEDEDKLKEEIIPLKENMAVITKDCLIWN